MLCCGDTLLALFEVSFLGIRGEEEAGRRGDVSVDVEAGFIDGIKEGEKLVVVLGGDGIVFVIVAF